MVNDTFNVERVQRNLQVLTELRKETPNPDVLKQYAGWGGLRSAMFTPDIYSLIKKTCSEREVSSIKKSMSSAYYTPPAIIRFMYDALALLRRPFANVLEPSAGHGIFFDLMPDDIKKSSNLFAVEMDEVSFQLLKYLYPCVHSYHGGFETYQPQMRFDLIIGNPPYGREIVQDERHMDLSMLRIHHYFVAKCMRMLEPGGILAMVLPRYFMDNRQDHARQIIHKEGGSLLAAYRLPDNLFSDAKVTVDVVFMVKKQGNMDWLYHDSLMVDGENVSINRYFSLNPNHVIGDLKIIEAYGKPTLTCRQSGSLDTMDALMKHLHAFPPKKSLSIEECKATLEKKLFLVNKEIQSLIMKKHQLTQAKRDIHSMEKQFIKKCFEQIPLNALLN